MNTNANRMNELDDDNTLPPPTPPPRRAAAVPIKSEPTGTQREVNVTLIVPIKSEPLEAHEPERLVTPPTKRVTRSSGSGSDLFDEKALAAARQIDKLILREKGWVHKNDSLYDWMWIPASIAGFKVEDIRKHGEDGVHFARGDIGLCKMLQTYGPDHAPEDLDDFPEKNNSFDIYELKDRVEKDLEEASKKAKSSSATGSRGAQTTAARKRGRRSGNLSNQAAKKLKPAASSSKEDKLGKKLEEKINKNARRKVESRRKDDLVAADPLGHGQAPSSDDSAQPYVEAAINAAIEEQLTSDDDEDTERKEGLALVINALSDRNSPRYSALLKILKWGDRTDMEKLLTLCIRALKV